MKRESIYITPEIKLSSYKGGFSVDDLVFNDHMLIWFISGETKIVMTDGAYLFTAGDIFLIPRHRMATIINSPTGGQPHKSVVMHLTAQRLKNFYKNRQVKENATPLPGIFTFTAHPLLQSCLASLIPYFEIGEQLPEEIADIKITEAITILRTITPDIDSLLANFEEPGKIELTGFMERHFMFNMDMEKFSYLTGRSLTTFRRDFKKAFHTTPQKWLTQKRLELAHYQMKNKKLRPNEVYIEAGFENLSHFSYAFKKQFGYAPSEA